MSNEVAPSVSGFKHDCGRGLKDAQTTDARIAELSHSAARHGDVVKLTTAIAECKPT
jgi:hypothetical protein